MVQTSTRSPDLASAETYLTRAREQLTAENSRWYYPEAIRVYWSLIGPSKAYDLLKSLACSGVTDKDLAEMLETLSRLEDIENDVFSVAALTELEIVFDRSRHSRRFALAYRYMDRDDTKFLAHRHFRALELEEYEKAAVLNNLGVTLSSAGTAAQMIFYERAISSNEHVAAGNVASQLIHYGFIDRAKAILDSIDDNETTTVADARKALLEAFSEVNGKVEKFEKQSIEDADRFRSVLIRGFEFFKLGNSDAALGQFVSDDRTIVVNVDPQQAIVEWKGALFSYRGSLARKSLYFQGSVSATGAGSGAAAAISGGSKSTAVIQRMPTK